MRAVAKKKQRNKRNRKKQRAVQSAVGKGTRSTAKVLRRPLADDETGMVGAVFCCWCGAPQPSSYDLGQTCCYCGKVAEPTRRCFWCSTAGPGKFCRQCGTEFVPIEELELALLLKCDGIAKEEVVRRLSFMSTDEKALLWQRVPRTRT